MLPSSDCKILAVSEQPIRVFHELLFAEHFLVKPAGANDDTPLCISHVILVQVLAKLVHCIHSTNYDSDVHLLRLSFLGPVFWLLKDIIPE